MIGLCTDSSAHMPPELVRRFGVEVVPQTVSVDGIEYLEGVDLDADTFYALHRSGCRPEVSVSQPSAGQFAAAYEDLAARGCSQILSIHGSTDAPATVRAARLAAHCSPVPVRLVDCGPSMLGVSCCIWAAGDSLTRGACVDQAASAVESRPAGIGSVVLASGVDVLGQSSSVTAPVVSARRDVLGRGNEDADVVSTVASIDHAVEVMARFTAGWGDSLNVAVGTAHAGGLDVSAKLIDAIAGAASVSDVVQFRIGPSAARRCGPDTISCLVFSPT